MDTPSSLALLPPTTLTPEQNELFLKAVEMNDLAFITLSIQKGIDVNAAKSLDWTLLMFAAQLGKTSIVSALIEASANLEATNKEEWTALMLAVAKGDAKTVSVLISAGANVNAKKTDGTTPLMLASKEGSTEMISILISAGAKIDAINEKGLNALAFAFLNENNKILFKRLLSAIPMERVIKLSDGVIGPSTLVKECLEEYNLNYGREKTKLSNFYLNLSGILDEDSQKIVMSYLAPESCTHLRFEEMFKSILSSKKAPGKTTAPSSLLPTYSPTLAFRTGLRIAEENSTEDKSLERKHHP